MKGHGLGLAISHSIVSRHGGAIAVESEMGKGTTFTVYLPSCADGEQEPSGTPEIRHAGEGTILVMDDDEAVRRLLSKILVSTGYSVTCTENGREAIEYFTVDGKDGSALSAVILDLTIPGGLGGKEVAAEIRKLNTEIPVFVSSGYADDPILANPADYGITASISKPFTKSELMEMLETHMRKRS